MTQQEFTQRTNIEVSYNEFEAINEVYMNSEVDKDEFCKMWVKMNKTRVANAIKAKKEAEESEAKKSRMAEMYWMLFYDLKSDEKFTLMGWEVCSKRDRKFLEGEGIEVVNALAGNMMYNMACYCGINK